MGRELKINCDGTLVGKGERAGVGVIIRDSKGMVFGGCSREVKARSS